MIDESNDNKPKRFRLEKLKPYIDTNPERDARGQFVKGCSGNPGGRRKNPIKEYVRSKFDRMTDAEKEEFIAGIPKEFIWKMAEGNPSNETELSGEISGRIIRLDE